MNALDETLRSSERACEGATAQAPATARSARRSIEARLIERLLTHLGHPPIEFLLWNGERVSGSDGEMAYQLRIKDRSTLFSLFKDSQVAFGDAYSDGRITIDGDLVDFLEAVYKAMPRGDGSKSLLARIADFRNRARSNTLEGSRDNIHHHYDIGNEFYAHVAG
jgi:cyclopropane-fatty-acyl-phospholipid synthase